MHFKTEAFQDSYSPEGFFCDLVEDEKTAAQVVEGFSIVVDRSWAATLQKLQLPCMIVEKQKVQVI